MSHMVSYTISVIGTGTGRCRCFCLARLLGRFDDFRTYSIDSPLTDLVTTVSMAF